MTCYARPKKLSKQRVPMQHPLWSAVSGSLLPRHSCCTPGQPLRTRSSFHQGHRSPRSPEVEKQSVVTMSSLLGVFFHPNSTCPNAFSYVWAPTRKGKFLFLHTVRWSLVCFDFEGCPMFQNKDLASLGWMCEPMSSNMRLSARRAKTKAFCRMLLRSRWACCSDVWSRFQS